LYALLVYASILWGDNMSCASKIKIRGVEYDLKDSSARTQIGNLSELATSEKSNLVSAINELSASGSHPTVTSETLVFLGGALVTGETLSV